MKMQIHIEALRFQCILGILDFERNTPQDVIINLSLEYEYVADSFINYAEVAKLIKDDMCKEQYHLIEDALTSLCVKIFHKFPTTQTIYLKITKPSILADTKVSVSTNYICHT